MSGEIISWEDIEKFVAPEQCTYNMDFTELQKRYLTYFFKITPRRERARIAMKLFPGMNFRTLTRYIQEWEIEGRITCKR